MQNQHLPDVAPSASRARRSSAPDPFTLERRARDEASTDPTRAATLAREAADAFRDRLRNDPDDSAAAAGLLRCLRRAAADWDEVGPAIELTASCFPEAPAVLGAAGFLFLDGARAALERGDAAGAAKRTAAALEALASQRDPSYLALASIGPLRALGHVAGETLDRTPEETLPALDALLEGLAGTGPIWAAALPEEWPNADPADRGPSPRLSAWLAVRRLGRLAERWDVLAALLPIAREGGLVDEWLLDTEVEALARCGRDDEALERLRVGRRRFPNSEALARREAWVLGRQGLDREAEAVLSESVLSARSPWPWRDLAERARSEGRDDEAGVLLRCALAFENAAEPGPTWGLHLDLAELALAAGDEPEAALELWLARRARQVAGWGAGRRIAAFLREAGPTLDRPLAELDTLDPAAVLGRARRGYRDARSVYLERRARPATVRALKPTFAFLEVEGIAGQVFARTKLPGADCWEVGQACRVVVVRSFDAKRNRPSWQAVHALPAS